MDLAAVIDAAPVPRLGNQNKVPRVIADPERFTGPRDFLAANRAD